MSLRRSVPIRLPLALAIATVGCVFPFAAHAFAAPAVMTAASQSALIFGMVALRFSIAASGSR